MVAGAAAGLIGMLSTASGAVSSLGIGSATVAPGGRATVALTAVATADDGTANGGPGDGIGAWQVDVAFGPDSLKYVSCTSVAGGVCSNPSAGVVRFTGANVMGLTGSFELGAVTLLAVGTEGTTPLAPAIKTLTDPEGSDIQVVMPRNGSITVQAPIPEPTTVPSAAPAPADTASPPPTEAPETPSPKPASTESRTVTPSRSATPKPVIFPEADGDESDGSSNSILWVLGAFGLAVLAGGVWAVSRTRRHGL